jgi:hypothetical protein
MKSNWSQYMSYLTLTYANVQQLTIHKCTTELFVAAGWKCKYMVQVVSPFTFYLNSSLSQSKAAAGATIDS